nr:MAG TPA: hypothetical protein [Caudoviricetes sp.]
MNETLCLQTRPFLLSGVPFFAGGSARFRNITVFCSLLIH